MVLVWWRKLGPELLPVETPNDDGLMEGGVFGIIQAKAHRVLLPRGQPYGGGKHPTQSLHGERGDEEGAQGHAGRRIDQGSWQMDGFPRMPSHVEVGPRDGPTTARDRDPFHASPGEELGTVLADIEDAAHPTRGTA